MRQVKEFNTQDGKRYRVRYRVGDTQTSQTFRNKRDAQTFAGMLGISVTDALAWLDAQNTSAGALTFGTFFDQYVDQLTGVSPRTRNDYRSLHRRYLTHLDDIPLPLLHRKHVTDLVNSMDAARRAPRTIKDTVSLLSTCLTLAVDEHHMTNNPCRRVRLPTQGLDTDEANFLTHEEFTRLHAAMPAHYQPLVAFLVGTGLRWSEATALQSKHVNLGDGTVRVRQAWKRVPGRGFEIGPPKTRKSTRTVNAAVMALAAVQPLLGDPDDFVFTTKTGGPVRHANFYTHVWAPACKAAGFNPAPRIRQLRSTHGSWLVSAGIQLEAVQDQLGHESILTTRKLYAHLLPALGLEVGRAASQALSRALPDGVQSPRRGLVAVLDGTDESADPDSVGTG